MKGISDNFQERRIASFLHYDKKELSIVQWSFICFNGTENTVQILATEWQCTVVPVSSFGLSYTLYGLNQGY